MTLTWTDQDADWASVTALTARKLDVEWRDDLNYLHARPALSAFHNSNQDSAYNTDVKLIDFDTLWQDTAAMRWTDDPPAGYSTNSLFVIRRAGCYTLSATAHLTEGDFRPRLGIATGATPTIIGLSSDGRAGSTYPSVLRVETDWEFAEGDRVYAVTVGVTNFSPFTIKSIPSFSPTFSAIWKGA